MVMPDPGRMVPHLRGEVTLSESRKLSSLGVEKGECYLYYF